MLESILQLGDAVEHRGIVIAPLFPRRTPVAEYATLAPVSEDQTVAGAPFALDVK